MARAVGPAPRAGLILAAKPRRTLSWQRVRAVVSILYLVVSLLCSWWYIAFLCQYTYNDTFMFRFNEALHVWIMDVMNEVDFLGDLGGTLELTSTLFAQSSNYTDVTGSHLVKLLPTYPRYLLYTQRIDPALAIAACRQATPRELLWTSTQFCWVDFDHTWEMAHTIARQRRCRERYRDNGAVYFEAFLRNTKISKFMDTFGGPDGIFTVTVQRALVKTAKGRTYLQNLVQRTMLSVEEEVAFWISRNITTWRPRYQNFQQIGLSNSLTMKPAIEMINTLKTNTFPKAARVSMWTTFDLALVMFVEMSWAKSVNQSLVRGEPDFIWTEGTPQGLALGLEVLYGALGPLYSIDLDLIPPPRELLEAYREFTQQVRDAQWTNTTFSERLSAISKVTWRSPPIEAWRNASIISGSFLCPYYTTPTSYLQAQWSFDDPCSSQDELIVTLSGNHLLFAMWMLPKAIRPSILGLCSYSDDTPSCLGGLQAAMALVNTLGPPDDVLVLKAVQPVADIEIVQLAISTSTGTTQLLRQRLIDKVDEYFVFLGWSLLFDWAHGVREVVQFHGDVGLLRLLSSPYQPSPMEPIFNEIPDSIAVLVVVGVTYVSFVLTIVGCGILFLAVYYHLALDHRNIYFFSRVTGFTWVGRPLLFIRGVNALMLLSSSLTTLETRNGLTKLSHKPRTIMETLLTVSEATWITYVAGDMVYSPKYAYVTGPLTSLVTFVALFVTEENFPVITTVTLTRNCRLLDIDSGLVCTNNLLTSGSGQRLTILVGLCVLLVLFCDVVCRCIPRLNSKKLPHAHMWYTSVALSYFHLHGITQRTSNDEMWLDQASNFMNGLVIFQTGGGKRHYVLDIKSWQCLRLDREKIGRRGTFCTFQKRAHAHRMPSSTLVSAGASAPLGQIFCGFLYILSSLSGSILYLTVLQSKMSNDFWWMEFNTTGGHRFLAKLLEKESQPTTIYLEEPQHALLGAFNTSTDTVPVYFSHSVQAKHTTLSSLAVVIRGLREMDACLAPWVGVQYCWVDFERRWEMANSLARQRRCTTHQKQNGAAYLESTIRNVDARRFLQCWNAEFITSFGSYLESTLDGQAWLQRALYSPQRLDDQDEAALWHQANITTYKVQWQNYKMTGYVNTYTIENAFGMMYPLTLQVRNGTWRINDQTSWKMYWTLANDLWGTTTMSSSMLNMSLVRGSPSFAFENTSIASHMQQMGYLDSPMLWSGMLFQDAIGPYGSVDITYIVPPSILVQFFGSLERSLQQVLYEDTEAALTYANLPAGWYQGVVPASWQQQRFDYFGGTPLCFNSVTGQRVPFPYLDTLGPCTLPNVEEGLYLVIYQAILTSLAANMTRDSIRDTCQHVTTAGDCKNALENASLFLGEMSSQPKAPANAEYVHKAMDALNVSLFEFTRPRTGGQPRIATFNVFSNQVNGWAFWAWCYMYQWTSGQREVVSFHGDKGHISVLSTSVKTDLYTLNALEIPHSLSLYFLRAVQYVTFVLLTLAALLLIYIVSNRGHIEPYNLLKLNSVGAIVWIGRPLLLIRAVSALCLLSTGQLHLRQSATGLSTRFQPSEEGLSSYIQTTVVSGEVCWLTYIIHDILSMWTGEYTRMYASKSFFLVWAAMVVVQFAQPLRVSVNIAPKCTTKDFDFQLVCESGHIQVGDKYRVVIIVLLELVCIGVCWLWSVCHHQKQTRDVGQRGSHTLYLYSLAAHLFHLEPWTVSGVLYLDKASALLNGLIVVGYRDHLYMLDIKTWRTYTALKPEHVVGRRRHRLESCLPMASEWH